MEIEGDLDVRIAFLEDRISDLGECLVQRGSRENVEFDRRCASVEADAEALADLSADALFPPEQAVSARRLAAASATISLEYFTGFLHLAPEEKRLLP